MKVAASVPFVLFLILAWGVYSFAQAQHRVAFLEMKNQLREAHVELQRYGSFTNSFPSTRIYRLTNQLLIAGVPYQPEFAAEKDEFRGRGFLTITTNELFVWVDKKHGPRLANRRSDFPAGL